MMVSTLDLQSDQIAESAARMLVAEFREMAPNAWPDFDSARAEIHQIQVNDGFLVGAYDDAGTLAGWAGGLPLNGAAAWELHPLVVDRLHRRRGVGRALVDAVALEASRRGACVLFAGSDDEAGWTSLAGRDLWDDPLGHLARINNPGNHPYEFYLRIGFRLVGVLPDANGPGRPDIWLARPIPASA